MSNREPGTIGGQINSSVTSRLSTHQRRPGNEHKPAAPDQRWLISHGCSSLNHGIRRHTAPSPNEKRSPTKEAANSFLSFSLQIVAVTDSTRRHHRPLTSTKETEHSARDTLDRALLHESTVALTGVRNGAPSPVMEDLLKCLSEVSIRQQQIMEHIVTRQEKVEEDLVALRLASAQRAPLPDPRVQATQLMSKLTSHDNIELFLQMFETLASREGWDRSEWAQLLGPLLTGEAQRAYFTLPRESADDYDALKREILGRLARAQAAELARLTQHWLLDENPSAGQVAERVTVDHLLQALRNSTTLSELVEPIELAEAAHHREAGERAPSFTRRVVQERRTPEGTSRHIPRPGEWQLEVGILKELPVPVLLARDCPGFEQLLTTATQPASTAGSRRKCRTGRRTSRPALLASDSGRDGESPFQDTNLFYDVFQQRRGEVKELLIVPKSKAETVIELAHTHPMAGHLGTANTIQRIRDRFHWPGLDGESTYSAPRSPLKSARGHEHVLVIVNYATRYPEAIPLRKATAKAIAKELFLLCTRVGIPAEILTDQGTPFMSRLMADLCRLLQVKQLRTTVYHPQTDRLVECFNQTLKQMLRRVAAEDKRDWDLMLPYVLFGIREVPQASTGFTPFELLFGCQPRGLLDVAREAWEQQQPTPLCSVVEHMREMRERIEKVMPLVREHVVKAQQSQQRLYNRAAQPREFKPGDKVMVLVPTAACRQQEEQLYHVNLLKRWVGTREQLSASAHTDPVVVDVGEHLSAAQKTELQHLISQFSDVFSTRPGRANVIEHDICTPPGVFVRQRPYRVSEARRQAIEDEIGEMLKFGVIDPSRSAWSSPIVMVPKPDGTLCFCNDFRRLNQVSEFDGYPMPQVDELLERLGRAHGHWQYRTLPFGLHGALATFQRMMDILLRPHQAYTKSYTLRPGQTVLRAPDFNCPFLLQTDASDTGLGAVLSQVRDGEEHPVMYISRKLTPAETRYAAVEREVLAIKWAVLELRYYLLGRRFTLMTDHAPLQWMASAKDTNARVTRWSLALQDFHFSVEHRAGATNANAFRFRRSVGAHSPPTPMLSILPN
ncbi:Retrovirus-related Pol polyprotein from transposon 17.6 [Labeo rohita]|uniref:Gypsy retrotransposon integrase-like protein 1 n=1 Tax=Labeo rohita TaxID=84645 RepID=A0ABQ8MX52_LABRO|nr:Retrovirus-related Pol polyprotein from transposon 17.6 [Labeo rohita]